MTLNTRKREYKIEEFTIDENSISQFEILPNRRQISEVQVGKIHGRLLAGKNPIGILIVNKKNNKLRLIDGNHRLEAIKKYYNYREIHKDVKIECVLKVYNNLTEEEEREVYIEEANRRDESYEDRLNIYKETIMFWKLINDPINSFPSSISIYNGKNSLRFRNVLNALNIIKNSSEGGYHAQYLGKDEVVAFAKSLTYDDFILLKEFVTFFQEIFGKIGRENMYCKVQFFIPLFDIYAKNRKYSEDANFKERFQRMMGRTDIMSYTQMGGREAQLKIRTLMIDYGNWRVSKNLFV